MINKENRKNISPVSRSADYNLKHKTPIKPKKSMQEIVLQLKSYIEKVVSNPQDVKNLNELVDDLKNKFQQDIGVIYQANRLLVDIQRNYCYNEKGPEGAHQKINFLPINSKTILKNLNQTHKQIAKDRQRQTAGEVAAVRKSRLQSQQKKVYEGEKGERPLRIKGRRYLPH